MRYVKKKLTEAIGSKMGKPLEYLRSGQTQPTTTHATSEWTQRCIPATLMSSLQLT